MKNIVIVCPTIRDRREIDRLSEEDQYGHNYIFYGTNHREDMSAFDPGIFIEKFLDDFKDIPIDGIIGTHDYPASIVSSILSEKLKIPGPGILPNLVCQHKYFSRIYQEKVAPDAVPGFFLIGKNSP